MSNMGRRIAARRTELGMTQQELADKLSLSRQAISMYETGGIADMRGRTLAKLAAALQVGEDWILFGDGYPAHEAVPESEQDGVLAELLEIIRHMSRREQEECLEELRARERKARELYEELKRRFER